MLFCFFSVKYYKLFEESYEWIFSLEIDKTERESLTEIYTYIYKILNFRHFSLRMSVSWIHISCDNKARSRKNLINIKKKFMTTFYLSRKETDKPRREYGVYEYMSVYVRERMAMSRKGQKSK